MKIDSHQHFWKYDPGKHSWIDDSMAVIRRDFLPQDLEPSLKENGIEGTILVQVEQSEVETEFLLSLASECSFIKGVVGWIDLTGENVEDKLKHFSGNNFFKGIRHTVYDEEGEFLQQKDFQEGLRHLGRYGLTYDLLVFEYQLDSAIALVKKFPEQVFILNHLAKPRISGAPSKSWIKKIRELAENKNVNCKLSGLVTQGSGPKWQQEDFKPYLEVVADAFGSDRLLYGSDWPVCLSAASYANTLEIINDFFSNTSESEQKKIMGGNAARIYSLE